MASPVVVDGRLDREKLLELLAIAAEHGELDFKGSLDLQDGKQRLGLVLDIVAMMNTATGGFIIIGAHDSGKPAHDLAPLDTARFDSANLAAYVARHIAAQPRVTSQIHAVENRNLVLIHVAPTMSGLPAIISKTGEYDAGDGRTKKVVFQQGVVYTREGTRNPTASDVHWDGLLARYRSALIAEAREGADLLIRRFVESLGTGPPGARPAPPLLLEMDNESFVQALRQHLDSENDAAFRRFTREALSVASFRTDGDLEARDAALDKLALAAIEALRSERRADFDSAIDALHRIYISAGAVNEYATSLTAPGEVAIAQHWLAVLIRVWLIGAAAERERDWESISSIAQRPVELDRGESYPSWLRHGIVYASRAHQFANENRGDALVISMAREHAAEVPEFADDALEHGSSQELLDSLVRFDILWCAVMAVRASGDLAYWLYPSAAAFNQERSNPALRLIVTNAKIREGLAPGASDRTWAVALRELLSLAVGQSRNHGTFWRGLEGDRELYNFVATHAGEA